MGALYLTGGFEEENLFLIWKCLFSKYNFLVSNLSTKTTRTFVQSFGNNRIYFIFWRQTSFAVETECSVWTRTGHCFVVIERVGKWEVEPSSSALLRSNILYVSRWKTCNWERTYLFDFFIITVYYFSDILVPFQSERI
jgi:hypothetical protein